MSHSCPTPHLNYIPHISLAWHHFYSSKTTPAIIEGFYFIFIIVALPPSSNGKILKFLNHYITSTHYTK